MEQQWLEVLRSWGDIAKDLAGKVPEFIARPELSRNEAQELWDQLGGFADKAEQLAELMDDNGADESFVSAAETLQDMFLDLHQLVGNRLIELGGLRGPLRPEEMDI